MTTFAQLETDCRELIGDTGSTVFTANQVQQWINDAIRDISLHFPLRKTYDINTAANDREYDLTTEFIGIISVEYPQGEDPPEYLLRRSYTHPLFWLQDGYYDFIPRRDATSTNKPEIWISTKPAADETIRIEYMCEHTALSAPTDVLTILPRHEHLIHLFVRWKAWQELATSEGMDPDPIKLLAATQEVNATRAERQYREGLRIANKAENESARASGWQMDKFDRTY